MYFIINIQI